jgi:hypothetical protein
VERGRISGVIGLCLPNIQMATCITHLIVVHFVFPLNSGANLYQLDRPRSHERVFRPNCVSICQTSIYRSLQIEFNFESARSIVTFPQLPVTRSLTSNVDFMFDRLAPSLPLRRTSALAKRRQKTCPPFCSPFQQHLTSSLSSSTCLLTPFVSNINY